MTRASGEIFGGKSVGSGGLTPRNSRGRIGQVDSGVKGVTVPGFPTSLSVSATAQTTATIAFTPPSDTGNSDITNYEFSTDGTSFTALSPADATSPVVVTGLSGNTSYTVYLRAVNEIGFGNPSSGVSATTLPGAPTGLSTTSTTTTTATIAFTPPSGSATITNYEFSTNGSTWTALSPADATSPVTVTGLSSNTANTIYLRAVNSAGSGTASSGVAATTLAGAPTGLSTSSTTTTTATISFTPPTGAVSITNYEFSTNGSTWTALSPADATSPVTVTGLTANTAYTIYLRAVNSAGSGTASSGVAATTQQAAPTSLQYLVVAGGGNGGYSRSGGGGGGGFRTSVPGATSGGGASAETPLAVSAGSSYTVTVGAGGGNNSVLGSVTSVGGGYGASENSDPSLANGGPGGSGGGSCTSAFGVTGSGGAGTANQGYAGQSGGGGVRGGGAGATGAAGGTGVASSITGSSVTYARGGAGDSQGGSSAAGAANTGNGGDGADPNTWGGTGGSGIVVFRYADTLADITTISAGLTYTRTVTGGYKIYSFTAGTGTITV